MSSSISQPGSANAASGSPPQSGRSSPPMPITPSAVQSQHEAVELQIDFWPLARPIIDGKEKSQTKDKDQGKNSIKSTFRSLQVTIFFNVLFTVCLKFFIFLSTKKLKSDQRQKTFS